MIVAWVLFPVVLLAVCVGLGLAVERLAGVRLPGTVLASAGLALLIVAATLMTYRGATAKFTTALVVVLAVAGYASSGGRVRELRPEPYPLALGLLLYAILAAPVVLSGDATFLGYFQLNDSAVHFALINQLLAHGRELSGVDSSSLRAVLNSYLSTDYPVGAQVALGAVRPLVGQNVAWIFQPYLAVIASLGGLALYQLLDGIVSSRRLRALCAFVAAQPGLLYGFYLEASIKELATAWVITLVVVLVFATLREELRVRRLVPLVIATVAAFDLLNVAIVPWLGVPLAVFVALALWRARHVVSLVPRGRLALVSGACLLVLAALASPIIATAKTSFNVLSSQLTKHGDLGNLPAPLSKWQLLGIWPSGDFRIPVSANYYRISHAMLITDALIGLAVASALAGTAWAIRRRAGAPLLLLAGSGLATIYLLSRASPYASAKVMMIFSVAVMLMVMLGTVALCDVGSRLGGSGRAGALAGWALAAILTGGVLWTNLEAYRATKVAPRARLAELASIGPRFSRQGPAFYNLSDEFAIDFLGPEALTDPAFQPPVPRHGLAPRTTLAQMRGPWDLDELDEPYVQSFPLLVLGRSPLGSRPPADYRLVYRGRFSEVWRRAATPRVLEHLPLGGGLDPAALPRCATVMALAKRASGERARLAYATRAPLSLLLPRQARHSASFQLTRNEASSAEPSLEPHTLALRQAGTLVSVLNVASAGRYEVWLEGSFSRRVEVRIDGRRAGSAEYEIGPPGQLVRIGVLDLVAGTHRVSIVVPSEGLAPGERSRRQLLGPLVLAPASDPEPVAEVEPARALSLCGQRLDWIEIVG